MKEKPDENKGLLPFLLVGVILLLALDLYAYAQLGSLKKQIISIDAEAASLKSQAKNMSEENRELVKNIDSLTYEKTFSQTSTMEP